MKRRIVFVLTSFANFLTTLFVIMMLQFIGISSYVTYVLGRHVTETELNNNMFTAQAWFNAFVLGVLYQFLLRPFFLWLHKEEKPHETTN